MANSDSSPPLPQAAPLSLVHSLSLSLCVCDFLFYFLTVCFEI